MVENVFYRKRDFFFLSLINKSAGRVILLGMTQSYEQAFVCLLILNNQSKFIKMLQKVLFPGIFNVQTIL